MPHRARGALGGRRNLDGGLSANLWVVNTLDETYGEEHRTVLPGAERARIQVVYVPASRDGARQLTAFLRGRLWRAAQWSDELRELVAASAAQVSGKFHDEAATSAVEKALSQRWQELHGAGTHSIPRFQPIAPDVAELLRGTEEFLGTQVVLGAGHLFSLVTRRSP